MSDDVKFTPEDFRAILSDEDDYPALSEEDRRLGNIARLAVDASTRQSLLLAWAENATLRRRVWELEQEVRRLGGKP